MVRGVVKFIHQLFGCLAVIHHRPRLSADFHQPVSHELLLVLGLVLSLNLVLHCFGHGGHKAHPPQRRQLANQLLGSAILDVQAHDSTSLLSMSTILPFPVPPALQTTEHHTNPLSCPNPKP